MDFAGRKIYTQGIKISGKGNIVINGRRLTLNGDLVKDFNDVDEKVIYVIINGDVNSISVDSCEQVEVKGNADSVKTISGDVKVDGCVSGNLSTVSGDVDCGDVGCGVSTTSGDVRCKSIGGDVKTISGDIVSR